jgi:hypothetical protein
MLKSIKSFYASYYGSFLFGCGLVTLGILCPLPMTTTAMPSVLYWGIRIAYFISSFVMVYLGAVIIGTQISNEYVFWFILGSIGILFHQIVLIKVILLLGFVQSLLF